MSSDHRRLPTAFLTRRQLLQVGGLGMVGLTLPQLLRANSQTKPAEGGVGSGEK